MHDGTEVRFTRILKQRLGAASAVPSPKADGELRLVLTEFVDELRALGLPPEKVVLQVKSVVEKARVQATDRRSPARGIETNLRGVPHRTLLEDLVTWSIEAYYPKR